MNLKKICLLIILFPVLCFSQVSPNITNCWISLPYGNITNKLPSKDTMYLGLGVSPDNAFGYKTKWSLDYGGNVAHFLNDTTGLIVTDSIGLIKVKCHVSLNGKDTFATKDVYVVSAALKKTGYTMTFLNGAATDAWIGEHSEDSTPVFTTFIEGGFLKLTIDKLGPLDSVNHWPLLSWKYDANGNVMGYGFSALRLSMCPVSGLLLNMSQRPVVTMKLRTTTDCNFQLGVASKNTPGNNNVVFRRIKASANFSLVSFYFGGITTFAKINNVVQSAVDSTSVSHFFLNFNPGGVNTKHCRDCAGPLTQGTQPNDFKGIVEIQFIKFGNDADLVSAQGITIKQYKTDPLITTKRITVNPDTVISSKFKPQFVCQMTPSETTIPFLDWSVSDTTMASIKSIEIDSGMRNVCVLAYKKPGVFKLIAKTHDGSNLTAELSLRFYDAVSTPVVIDDVYEIYPNPVNTNLTINQAEDIDFIEIIEITGRRVTEIKHDRSSSAQIDMSRIQPGIYILKVRNTNGDWLCKKIIKE